MTETALDKVRLRFRGDIEQTFREEYCAKSLNQLRFGIALATLLYAFFGILDVLIFPRTTTQTWFIRYVVVCPVCLLTFLLTYSNRFKKYLQPAVFCAVLIGGGGIVAMMVIVRSPINYFHFAGLLLVIMYNYTFSKLWFLRAATASWLLVGFYEIAATQFMVENEAVFLNDNFFFIAANLIGMFSCYHRELYVRKDFLKSLTIKKLAQEKHGREREKLFRDLHDGIGNITTNIGLLTAVAQKEDSVDGIKKKLATIADLSQEGMIEIRNIMQSFDTAPKTWDMMASELRRQGNAMIEPHGLAFDIKTAIDGDHREPDSFVWLNLFRIYKEALMNVMKHAKATTISVVFTVTSRGVLLSVHDNGVGIGKENTPGRGIANMKARAQEIGGLINISGDRGTLVNLELPSMQYPVA